MVLNLDNSFNPFPTQNTIAFQSFTFSGGEPHIKIDPDFNTAETVTITHRLNSFDAIGMVCLAVDALRRMGVKSIEGFFPYFPAARQDRVMIAGEPLSVKVNATIINALQLNKITIFDSHSEVAPALLDNCEALTNHIFIQKVLEEIGQDTLLVAPDGGALKKIYKVSQFLGGKEVIECSKKRDVKSGKLSGFKVYSEDLKGQNCLIVDDICDGGGTFLGLAEELKKNNAGKLYLAISHGIFNKGFDTLNAVFAKIYTTNSFQDIKEPNVTQMDIKDLI